MLRLLLGHPEVEIGALTGGSNAGQRLGALQPHLVPLADRVLEPTRAPRPSQATTWCSSACRTASPGRSPPSSATTSSSSTAAPTSGSRTRGSGRGSTAASTPAPGPTACPSCPDSARAALRAPRRRPGLLPHGLHAHPPPAVSAGLVSPTVVVAASGTSGAGKSAEAAPAGQRDHGQRQRLRRRRRAPAHPGDHAEPLRRSPSRPARQLHARCWCPMSRGILATCSAPLPGPSNAEDAYAVYARPTPTSRSCTCCPPASGPRPSP